MEPDFVTVTQYLPKLPKSNLDDRTFEDLVEECLLRIPRYCPEWTNYNPGDPGVTLIELFAWLMHQMLYRFNQVPRRHYVAFLELLGIRLLPPAPARTSLTFYLTKAQTAVKLIPAGTEVATIRTENQEAVIFTTDETIVIGQPRLKHFLFGTADLTQPRAAGFINSPNRFENTVYEETQNWSELELSMELFTPCQVGSCFYLVVEPAQIEADSRNGSAQFSSVQNGHTQNGHLGHQSSANRIEGNVLAFTFKGPAAMTTGINPNNPPLRWQAWDGTQWCDGILRERLDDKTKGFSFDRLGEAGPNPEQEGADVILHLPPQFPSSQLGHYQGHWIRCLYIAPDPNSQQFSYQRSPEITGISLRAIGAVGTASECMKIGRELVGISNGKPGQTFELSRKPILQRHATEHVQIRLPDDRSEDWEEVSDFGDSTVTDPHYLIDNSSGTLQFGPLILEPDHSRQQTQERSQLQSWGRPDRVRQNVTLSGTESALPAVLEAVDRQGERQYGKVPPLGSEIYMTSYRVGGGSQGNVQAEQLTVLKSSIPYVKQVTNYQAATGGLEAEGLEQAMMRVPALLRTRKTALTPEDFERTAKQFREGRAVYRAHCMTKPHLTTPGVLRLLIIPYLEQSHLPTLANGVHPHQLMLDTRFQQGLQAHLNLHQALGIRATLEVPEYIGIQVRVEIYPQLQNRSLEDRSHIARQLKTQLYQFLNPITGGFDQQGWPLGRSVQSSDIVALLQKSPHVQSVGQVELFKWQQYRHQGETEWMQLPTPMTKVELAETEIVTSWSNPTEPNSGHEIIFLAL